MTLRDQIFRLKVTLRKLWRRRQWVQEIPQFSAIANLLSNLVAFAFRAERAGAMPSIVKIDISPQCSLACPHCLHADPAGRGKPLLDGQKFGKSDKMSLAQYGRIIDELRGKAVAVSLYYYGDPLIHPDLDAMIAIARKARLSVHITTHFSYNLTQARIRALVESGLSHLTVAVDGATQESYATTRIRGRLDLVLKNLRMVAEVKRELGTSHPLIEVQHLRFPHHPEGEEQRVREIVETIPVDRFMSYDGVRLDESGELYNVVDEDAVLDQPAKPLGRGVVPRCLWPHSSTVIRFDGAVIPCCIWRVGQQYGAAKDDTTTMGNVFDEPLAKIWNNPRYRRIRGQIANPAKGADQDGRAGTFCDGCPKLCTRSSDGAKPLTVDDGALGPHGSVHERLIIASDRTAFGS